MRLPFKACPFILFSFLAFFSHSPLAAQITLSSSPSTSAFGQTVYFSVSGPATGSYTLFDGPVILGTTTATQSFNFKTPLLSVGTHNIRAYYVGDATHAAAVSNTLTQVVSAVASAGLSVGAPLNLRVSPQFLGIGNAFLYDDPSDVAIVMGTSSSGTVGVFDGVTSLQAAGNPGVGRGPNRIAMQDLNGDGYPELIVTNQADNTVSVLNGSNAFVSSATYATGQAPASVVAGDFNGDGRPDIAVANSGDGTVSIFLGKSDGTLQTAAPVTSGGTPQWITIGDFNGDGKTDLALADPSSNSVVILLGNGDGTFQPPERYSTDIHPVALVAIDLIGNGRTDLATANSGGNDVSVLIGKGDGTFQPAVNYPSGGQQPVSIAAGDINGDGSIDLVVANAAGNTVAALPGKGDGTLNGAIPVPTGPNSSPMSVVITAFGNGLQGNPAGLAVADSGNNSIGLIGSALASFQAIAITATHPPIAQGQNGATFSVAVNNTGFTATSGTLSLSYLVNSGLTLLSAQGAGWTCSTSNNSLATCSNSNSLAPGQMTLPITFTVNVPANAPSSISNTVQISAGGGFPVQFSDIVTPLLNQILSFAPIPSHKTGDAHFSIAATASSGLIVSFSGSGQCSLSGTLVTITGAGSCSITASQAGNATYAAATPVPQLFNIVGQAASVVLSSSTNAVQLGQPVTLTANVTPSTAAGAITFYDGVNVLGTGKIAGGIATFLTRALAPGNRSIRAYFGGDAVNAPAASATVPVVVTAVHGFGFGGITATSGVGGPQVAAGDFNGDGRADFAIQDTQSLGFFVMLGKADGTYQNMGKFGPSGFPDPAAGLVAGDFNSDGKVDLAVAANYGTGVEIFLGNGDGTFQPPVSYSFSGIATSLAAGDFNGDGKIDLVISNGQYNTVGVFLGNGDGTFQPVASYAAGSSPAGLAVGDVNGDHIPDLAVANDAGNNIAVLLGNGDGTFQAAKSFSTGVYPRAAVIADFNGDGKPDVATANTTDSTVSVLLGNGDGTFQAAATFAVDQQPYALAYGDFNGDGRIDLVTASPSAADISVLLGNGDGTFQPARNFKSSSSPSALAVGDFNGDGRADVAVSGGSFGIQPAFGPPDLAMAATHTSNFGSGENGAQYTLSVTNLGAGWSDDAITVTDTLPSIMTATAMAGNGWNCTLASLSCSRSDAFPPGAAYPNIILTVNVGTGSPSVTNVASVSAALGDPNSSNNGASDVTTILPPQTLTFAPIPDHLMSDPPFTVTATSSSGLPVTFTAAGNCSVSGATVTLTNIGSCSITATQPGNANFGPASLTRTFNISPAATSVTLSAGSQNPVQLGSPVTLTATASPSNENAKVTFYDGAALLGVAQAASGVATFVTPLLGAGNHKLRAYCLGITSNTVPLTVTALAGSFPAFNQPGISGIASALALGDVNGDGIPDIVVADYSSNAADILLGNGQGNFAPAVEYPAGGQPKAIALADFNGDGHLDLVVANTAGASVLLGNGNGTFQPQVYYPQNAAGLAVAVSDFDGDGKADFAVALNNSQVVILLGNGDGTFRNAGTFAMNSHSSAQTSTGLAVEDFNGDGKPDLALTDAANNALEILLGNGDGTFQSATSVGLAATPQSIALGDFNGDGVVDLVVGFNGQVGILLGTAREGFLCPGRKRQPRGSITWPWAISMAMASWMWPPHPFRTAR